MNVPPTTSTEDIEIAPPVSLVSVPPWTSRASPVMVPALSRVDPEYWIGFVARMAPPALVRLPWTKSWMAVSDPFGIEAARVPALVSVPPATARVTVDPSHPRWARSCS